MEHTNPSGDAKPVEHHIRRECFRSSKLNFVPHFFIRGRLVPATKSNHVDLISYHNADGTSCPGGRPDCPDCGGNIFLLPALAGVPMGATECNGCDSLFVDAYYSPEAALQA